MREHGGGEAALERAAAGKLTLRQVESLVFFAAMLRVLTLDGAWVGWLGSTTRRRRALGGIQSPNGVGPRRAAALPPCWLPGALLVLVYCGSANPILLQGWAPAGAQSDRRAFLRLGRWTLALGVLGAGAVGTDRFTTGAY
jgi:hypothetical protein